MLECYEIKPSAAALVFQLFWGERLRLFHAALLVRKSAFALRAASRAVMVLRPVSLTV
jgi:hypothetical protein